MNAPRFKSATHEHAASDGASSRAEGVATVTGIANRGIGVARVGGKVVFLPLTAPGDRVAYRIEREGARYSVGQVIEVQEPGPERVTPFCPLFGRCGGCQLQHLSYEAQRALKRHWVEDAFRRIGRMDAAVDEVTASPVTVGYRNKASIHVGDGRVGFLRAHSHDIVDVPECPVLEPRLQEAWPAVRMWAHSVTHEEPFRMMLRVGQEDSPLVVAHSRTPAKRLAQLAAALPHVRVAAGGERETVSYLCRGVSFDVEAGTFFQVNSAQLESMVGTLEALAPGGAVLVDGHAGVGWPSLCLAPPYEQVICAEIARRSCERGIANARRAGLDHVRFHRGTLASLRCRGALPSRPDVMLMDPPRDGLLPRDLEAAAAMAARSIVYVSCDPATQARDVARLQKGGYDLVRVIPFDLFPHTAHVESVALLTRRR
ncbi:class I SAM-dependent RNA methyltransferase [Candidatus Fermentibacteria bacterium]|nr:class I SAM-dependent RNA methyltransferase [Candidatus Fermentibacteria bacterium]